MIREKIGLYTYSEVYDRISQSYVRDKGSYSSRNDIIIKEDEVKLIYDLTLKQISELKTGHVVYFCPSSEVSRVKFREWARTKDISITYDSSKADVIVFSKNVIELFFEVLSGQIQPRKTHSGSGSDVVKKHLKLVPSHSVDIKKADHNSDTTIDFTSLGDAMETGRRWSRYGGYNNDSNSMLYIEVDPDDDDRISSYYCISRYNMKFYMKGIDVVIHAIYNANANAVFMDEKDVFKNTNTLVMDIESYKMCRDLLRSNDNDNTQVALEMCSNYNFDESFFYLALLKITCYAFGESLRYKSTLSQRLKPLFNYNKEHLEDISCVRAGYSYSTSGIFEAMDKLHEKVFSNPKNNTEEKVAMFEEAMLTLCDDLLNNCKVRYFILDREAMGIKPPPTYKIQEA